MLGKIKNVNPRKIWKNEAYDFTSWLDNLSCKAVSNKNDLGIIEI